MPKMKTKRGAAKRFRLTATGKIRKFELRKLVREREKAKEGAAGGGNRR